VALVIYILKIVRLTIKYKTEWTSQ